MIMKPTLYLETTIPSFVIGDISPVLVTAAHQAATRFWWAEKRDSYRIFISPVVIGEIERGKSEFSEQRLLLIKNFPLLEVTDSIIQLSSKLHRYLALPLSAETDVLHVALACQYKMDYLLTWNLKHIANGHVIRALSRFHDEQAIAVPTICTPEELLERSEET
jgi:predicted nucleic acid-binding protein